MRKISFLLVSVLLLATLIPALPLFAEVEEVIQNTFNPNDANPTISTKKDYIDFFNAAFVNCTHDFSGKTVTLLHDITFNDTTAPNWYAQEGVTKLSGTQNNWYTFDGNFDGGNHTLKGVIVEGTFSNGTAALFPLIYRSTIKDLNVDGFYVCNLNTSTSSIRWGRGGTGGLIGSPNGNFFTIQNCTMKNGIVTSVAGGQGSLGALIGHYHAGNTEVSVKITDTMVTDVRVEKGESNCTSLGGIFGVFLTQVSSSGFTSVLDFSGSVFQPIGSTDSVNTLNPLGKFDYAAGNGVSSYEIRNNAFGASAILKTGSGTTVETNTQDWNKAIVNSGIYGATAIPTVKLAGYQYSTEGDAIRFVGLIKKSVVDAHSVKELGFEVTVGETTVGTDKIQCTKVYESILENGKPLAAPDGYYYFTFVVTGVKEGTEFAVKGITVADEKTCNTTVGNYVYSRSAS